MIELMNSLEMRNRLNGGNQTAAQICIQKYVRVYKALKNGQPVNADKYLFADTCALCKKHDGACELCGLYLDGHKCTDGNSLWSDIRDAVYNINKVGNIHSFTILEPYQKPAYEAIRKMVLELHKIQVNDIDTDDTGCRCDNCGCSIDDSNSQLHNGDLYCDDSLVGADDNDYCRECYNEKFDECYCCHIPKYYNELNECDGSLYCNECLAAIKAENEEEERQIEAECA